MYATTAASDADHAVRNASPRPLRSRWRAATCGRSRANRMAVIQVPSVEALSTMVMRQVNGNREER